MREIVHLQTGQVRPSFYPLLAHTLTREKKITLWVISAVTKSVRFFLPCPLMFLLTPLVDLFSVPRCQVLGGRFRRTRDRT